MAKEKSANKEERRKEKREKKEKRSEKEGVHKSKKDKRERKLETTVDDSNVTIAVLNALETEKPGSVVIKEDDNVEVTVKSVPLLGALVPFANPLADEKSGKKVLKTVKKGKTFYSL